MKNKLKIQSEYFTAALDGIKKAEWRKNDRDYKVGDEYTLCEIDEKGKETGRTIDIVITHIVYGGKFDMPSDYCMFSFRVEGGAESVQEEQNDILRRALVQSKEALSAARTTIYEDEVAIKVLARMVGGAR